MASLMPRGKINAKMWHSGRRDSKGEEGEKDEKEEEEQWKQSKEREVGEDGERIRVDQERS